ncbi:MAG TPA: glycoside hydrolase family 6 protein [Streptosporangiaceae bacterium]|nr:glycoside hydrolase family 6 protein [Streptosporangiaceae bacterium]
MRRRRLALRALQWTATATLPVLALAAAPLTAGPASAATTGHTTTGRHAFSRPTRFYVPPADPGAIAQEQQLLAAGHRRDAALIARMTTTPTAVWLDGGTPAQVRRQVRQTVIAAARQRAEPVLVAYDIPGRDCAQYSAGGALTQADYEAWINGLARGIGHARAVVILEPDSLGKLPSDCNLPPSSSYPFTDSERIAEVSYAVSALEKDPGVSVYLDGTHSAWQSVGTMTQRLLEGGVQQAQGFYLDVSNYQPTPELVDYGTWISDCIAMVTDPAGAYAGNPSACASQYYPATQSDFSTWGLTTQWYAQNLGNAAATTHFVIDTSRNGNGPNGMTQYANPPYDQPASVISALAAGSWCDPPGAGTGIRPTADTGVALLDAYLWVKVPGESDGQCDAAGGVRAWDYSAYTQPGWPTTMAAQQLFDPLWGTDDAAAGAWFPQEALQLAQDATP